MDKDERNKQRKEKTKSKSKYEIITVESSVPKIFECPHTIKGLHQVVLTNAREGLKKVIGKVSLEKKRRLKKK